MGKRPKKKVILVLVEGKSDINALSYAIPKFFRGIDPDYEVYFPIIRTDEQDGGDITAMKKVYPGNIERKIYDLFLHDFLKNEGLYPKDITEIVQIIDTDGAYIPPENVVPLEAESEKKTLYRPTVIETQNVPFIIKRNEMKTSNIDYLISLDTIKVDSKTVKYSVYYFASNLDHFIHGEPNMQHRDKCNRAEDFSMMCMEDISRFADVFIPPCENMKGLDYSGTWDFIKEGTNSLGRYSNLHILLERIISESHND